MADKDEPIAAASEKTSKKSKRSMKKMATKRNLKILAIVLVVALVALFVYKYHQQQQEIKRLSDPKAVAQQEQQQIIDAVGKLTELPKNETPTVATVSDVNKLKDQAFFANAQNGDKVLIYSQSKQAILYRPSSNKVIQISSVNLGAQ
jgi:predicted negative regulator of RcsB-dependent stress response